MALTFTVPPNQTPCFSNDPGERAELSALFESTDVIDHREAAELCSGCLFRLGCFELAAEQAKGPLSWAGIPSGTWGGTLFMNGKLLTRRDPNTGRLLTRERSA